MTFNVAVIVEIVVNIFWCSNVEYTLNGPRRAALGAIEGEIPATTAAATVIYLEVASKVDMEYTEFAYFLTKSQLCIEI